MKTLNLKIENCEQSSGDKHQIENYFDAKNPKPAQHGILRFLSEYAAQRQTVTFRHPLHFLLRCGVLLASAVRDERGDSRS